MNEPFQLITNCTFKGKDYLVQMCVLNSKKLELIVTDKLMAEDWQCEYDASYIEALTHKTGNFKQFEVFIVMLKSGLLKTSECITLDLLTIEDLEELRNKKVINSYSTSRSSQNSQLNKRYLILTYSVEFDRIHYPLPLEYCGPPNPSVLQSNIRRLEAEVERLRQKNINLSKSEEGETKKLREQIKFLTEENAFLTNEVRRLNKMLSRRGQYPIKNMQVLQRSLKKLEERVVHDRNQNHQLMTKLKSENKQLTQQVEELKKQEKSLKLKLKDASRQASYRSNRRTIPSYLNSANSARRCEPVERSESLLFQPVLSCNSPTIPRSQKFQNLRKAQNRFLSSSSSESETVKSSKGKSREKITESIGQGKSLGSKSSQKSRGASTERSRHSSEDRKEKLPSQQSSKNLAKRNDSREDKALNLRCSRAQLSQTGVRSRESSLSSRSSSKKSKGSRLSNRGSGDHYKKEREHSLKTAESSRDDIKFTVSDLETRIHALRKLLSEGLNF